MNREDEIWIDRLQEVAGVMNLNKSESSRYRVLGTGLLNWVEFTDDRRSALFVQYHTDKQKHCEKIIDCDTALGLMKGFQRHIDRAIRKSSFIDPMYISPTDWTFVRDIEFEEVTKES